MKRLLSVMLILGIVLAGCSEDKKETSEDSANTTMYSNFEDNGFKTLYRFDYGNNAYSKDVVCENFETGDECSDEEVLFETILITITAEDGHFYHAYLNEDGEVELVTIGKRTSDSSLYYVNNLKEDTKEITAFLGDEYCIAIVGENDTCSGELGELINNFEGEAQELMEKDKVSVDSLKEYFSWLYDTEGKAVENDLK